MGSELLSGLVGALLVFVFQILYQEHKTKQAENEQRRALLKMIDIEIWLDQQNLVKAPKRIGYAEVPEGILFQDTAWREARKELARLVPLAEFEKLAEYYLDVRTAADILRDPGLGPAVKQQDLANMEHWMRVRAEAAREQVIQRYIPLTNYSEKDHEQPQATEEETKSLPSHPPSDA